MTKNIIKRILSWIKVLTTMMLKQENATEKKHRCSLDGAGSEKKSKVVRQETFSVHSSNKSRKRKQADALFQ